MKLTKEVIRLLKFHGYLTLTAPDDVFLNRFKTVEELGIAGFITDREAFDTLGSVFDENGVNQIAGMDEKNLTKQALNPDVIIIEEQKIDPVDVFELNRPVEDVVEPPQEAVEETVAEEGEVEDAVDEESIITEGDANEAPVEDFVDNVVEDHSNDEIPVPDDSLPETEAEPDQGEGVEENVVPKSTKSKPGKKKSPKKES